MDFLSIDLRNEIFSLWRQGEASVFLLLIITNHFFAQSEVRFIASSILMTVVVTCSAFVHNGRSSACSAHGMWVYSWSQMSPVKLIKRVDEMTPPCGTPDFH